ncbi:hypothetical protein RCL_jg25859.t1 [Rhizophagus clarus]|uniref:Uncharacterized protein n=1 Tax=Rhizophagus clarus TaxID=94130 RepID=A0A8H3LNR5_9GLOM|nr:hypothetical protein RCL_jg25859.t1 [Rhizophagus clarus]
MISNDRFASSKAGTQISGFRLFRFRAQRFLALGSFTVSRSRNISVLPNSSFLLGLPILFENGSFTFLHH